MAAFERAPTSEGRSAASIWTIAALLVALGGLAGSLYLSLGLHLRACPLCFYQRTFMMSVAAVLGVGLVFGAAGAARLGLLALPLALGGLGVAIFHVSLEMRGALECPAGVFSLGTAPQQSLAFFVLLSLLLIAATVAPETPARSRAVELTAALVVGAGLAFASCVANPPPPPRPATADAQPRDICWPPALK